MNQDPVEESACHFAVNRVRPGVLKPLGSQALDVTHPSWEPQNVPPYMTLLQGVPSRWGERFRSKLNLTNTLLRIV